MLLGRLQWYVTLVQICTIQVWIHYIKCITNKSLHSDVNQNCMDVQTGIRQAKIVWSKLMLHETKWGFTRQNEVA